MFGSEGALLAVTLLAGSHEVIPGVAATERFWVNVINGEGIFATAVHAAVVVSFKYVVSGKVDALVGEMDVAIQSNDRRELIVFVDRSQLLYWMMRENFGFLQNDKDESSLGGANTDCLIILVQYKNTFSDKQCLKNDRAS